MRICVLYFSRTGKTKYMAEGIANALQVPAYDIASSEPSVEDYDMIILGTPVEGARPAKETAAFIERLPTTDGKKAILFCTCRLFKGGTFKAMSTALESKGYHSSLDVYKKNVKIGETPFTDVIEKIKGAL
ncbi:MAG: flavodoxin family protein [Candidatus Bathyarchaeia archaeon]